jgi:hypothetical protein
LKKAALLALAGLALCVPAAWGAGKARTTVTIDSVFLGAGQTHYAGDISSPRKACKNNRRVLIFRARPGADEKVGSTRSFEGLAEPGYYWTYSETRAAPTGRYYAKVKPTKRCKGDRSPSLAGP